MPGGRPTMVRWRICALIMVASFVTYLLRSNMSVAGVPMTEELGLSQLQFGFVLGGFAWGYAIFQFPGGVLGDRVGARRAVAVLAVVWGLLTLLVGLVPGRAGAPVAVLLAALVGLRFLMGVAQAPFYPVTGGGTTCNWFPVGGWGLPGALQIAGLAFGSAAAGPLIAWLMGRYGWRESFLVTAPIAFLVAALWWWYVRDFPGEHRGVNQAECDLIDAGRPCGEALRPAHGAWRAVLRDRQILVLTAGYTCSNYVFYFFFNWLFLYLIASRGFRMLEGGFYSSAPWITAAFGAVLGGWSCDRLWRRIGARRACRILGAVALVLSGLFLLAAAYAPGPVAAVVLLSLCLGAQQFTDTIYWAATIAVAGRRSSAACGILNTGGNVVGGVGALAVPLIVTWLGWPAALASGALFAFAAAGLWLVTRADHILADG